MKEKANHCVTLWHKYVENDSVLERIRLADHAHFRAHPTVTEYIRNIFEGEFEEAHRASLHSGEGFFAPAPGQKWLVRVSAFRDPIDGSVIARTRQAFLAPIKNKQ